MAVELAEEKVSLTEFRARPTVASQLPLRFEGGPTWTEVHGRCASCKRRLEGEDLRGEVTALRDEGYRTSEVKLYYMDAQGYCDRCRLVTPFRYGMTRDSRLIGVVRRGGKTWLEVYARPPRSRWGRLKRWVRGLFRG